MSDTLWTVIVSSVAGIVVAFVTVMVSWRKAPADAAAIYQGIATKAGEQITRLEERCNRQDEKIVQLNLEIADLRSSIAKQDAAIQEYLVGITRLIKQIESHDMTPVWRPEPTTPATGSNPK